jgi:hypothetical protein
MITNMMIMTPQDTPGQITSRKVGQSHFLTATDTGNECQSQACPAPLDSTPHERAISRANADKHQAYQATSAEAELLFMQFKCLIGPLERHPAMPER